MGDLDGLTTLEMVVMPGGGSGGGAGGAGGMGAGPPGALLPVRDSRSDSEEMLLSSRPPGQNGNTLRIKIMKEFMYTLAFRVVTFCSSVFQR